MTTTNKELLAIIELESSAFRSINKAIRQLQGVYRLKKELDMPIIDLFKDIVELGDIRENYRASTIKQTKP
jgi:hypothetical protein